MTQTPHDKLASMLRAHANIKAKQAAANKVHKEANAKLQTVLDMIETALLKQLTDAGSDQLKVKGLAIVTPTKKIMPNCKDWPALWQYMKERDNFDMVARRLNSKTVKAYMKTHDDALPPGVTVHVERGVSVTRQN